MVHRHTPQLPLETPAPETEEARRWEEGVQFVVEIPPEDVRVEVEAFGLHRVEFELVAVEEALEAVGHRRRLHFLERRAPGDDPPVAFLELLLLRHHLQDKPLEVVGQFLGLRFRGVSAGDHRLPAFQVRIVAGLLAEETDPALEYLEVDLGARRSLFRRQLRPAGDLPRRHHVARHLE